MNRISRKEYDLVRDAPVESPDNEIRVKANRRRFVYVAYIVKLLEEGKHEQVTLIGSGMAIQVLLDTVKLLTTRVKGVHSCLKVEVSKRVMKFVPREEYKEELKPVEKTSTRTSMKAIISLKALDCITKSDAYMAPEDVADLIEPEKFLEIIKEYNEKERSPRDEDNDVDRRGRGRGRGRGGRGRGRGGRGRGGNRRHYDDEERSRSPRRGRGRGRGGRGRNDHYNRERNDDYERRGNDRRHHDNDDDYRRN